MKGTVESLGGNMIYNSANTSTGWLDFPDDVLF